MVGRAGRAGQAKFGEAFIIGRGDPEASFGDWKDICQLLVAPLPSLRSQLLLPSAFTAPGGAEGASGGGAAGGPLGGAGQLVGVSGGTPEGAEQLKGAAGGSLGGAGQLMVLSQSQRCEQPEYAGRRSQTSAGSASSQLSRERHMVQVQSSMSQQQPQSQTSFCPQLPAQLPANRCLVTNQSITQSSMQSASTQPTGHVAAGQNLGTTQPPPVQATSTQLSVTLPDDHIRDDSTQQLQRMLLEAIANGSIGSARDINRLIQSTLLSHQAQYSRMQLATKTALAALRCPTFLEPLSCDPSRPFFTCPLLKDPAPRPLPVPLLTPPLPSSFSLPDLSWQCRLYAGSTSCLTT